MTQLGREEHQQLAGRLVLRDQLLFQQTIAQDRKKISVQSFRQRGRAVDSAENFVLGLKQTQYINTLLLPPRGQIQYNSISPKTTVVKPYRNYLKKDAELKATLAANQSAGTKSSKWPAEIIRTYLHKAILSISWEAASY